jgi:hypothetical protein|tara:strand:- start:3356 stop:3517 length:162 start_codon:yes stop_codon:yes gene_type:complete
MEKLLKTIKTCPLFRRFLDVLLDTSSNISYPVRPLLTGVVSDLMNDRGEKEYG